jgi:hypothetical protein
LVSNPDIGAWYSGLCGEGSCLFCQTAYKGDGWFFGFFFLFSLLFWAVCYKWELWSCPTSWLASEQYLVSSVHWTVFNWDLRLLIACLWKVVRSVVFTRPQLCFPTGTTLSGQLLPPTRWGSSVLSTSLSPPCWGIHHSPALRAWVGVPPLLSAFVTCPSLVQSLAPYPNPILQVRFSVPPHPHCQY